MNSSQSLTAGIIGVGGSCAPGFTPENRIGWGEQHLGVLPMAFGDLCAKLCRERLHVRPPIHSGPNPCLEVETAFFEERVGNIEQHRARRNR